MPKLKTKKTLMKRIKITKSGKIMRRQNDNGHLKVKRDSSRKSRKAQNAIQTDKGHIRMFRRLLGKAGRGL